MSVARYCFIPSSLSIGSQCYLESNCPGKTFNCLKALAAKRSHVTHSGEMETEVYLKIKYFFFHVKERKTWPAVLCL